MQNYLGGALIFLVIAVVVTPLCNRLRVSPIIGYLLAGSIVGPHGLRLLDETPETHFLGELGIVFLLFMIGLELSLDRLRVIRRYVFGLGSAQVLLTAAAIGGLLTAVGTSVEAAVVLGLSLAFSSTAFVLQVLSERQALSSQVGRVSIAVLILQDLAVVPLLVLIPLLGDSQESVAAAMGLALSKAAVAMVIIFVASYFLLRPAFRIVAATRAPEVFVAGAILVVVGTAYATERFGLSASLGAFLAGVMLAGTEYRHQVEADLQPVRGLLLGLFFVTVGMLVNPKDVVDNWHEVLLGLLMLLSVKALLIFMLARAFGFPVASAVHLGLLLAQGGEFAFVVLSRAASGGLVVPLLVDRLVVVIAASMALTPLLDAIGRRMVRRFERESAEKHRPGRDVSDLSGHVIIAGFGRVGQTVAAVLRQRDIPFVALDRHPALVEEFRSRGEMVFFGDVRKVDVLKAVGADRARAAVLTLDGTGAERILARLRREFPQLRVLVRARDQRQRKSLEGAGASAVVPETLEGSLQLAGALLRTLGTPTDEVHELLDGYRRNDYALLEEVLPED